MVAAIKYDTVPPGVQFFTYKMPLALILVILFISAPGATPAKDSSLVGVFEISGLYQEFFLFPTYIIWHDNPSFSCFCFPIR